MTVHRGRFIGCVVAVVAFFLHATLPSHAVARLRVTFTKDIAPIVFAHCARCHRPGGTAPFSLITYAAVRAHAQDIALATRSRYMPPWKPVPGFGDFVGVRRLTDDQIALIGRWVGGGAVEGDSRDTPPTPQWTSGWQLGEPDLVLAMPQAYRLRADGDDMYRHFVIPIPSSGRRYVRAWELRVNNTHVVHHATLEFDSTGASRVRDERDPEPGYEGLIAHSVMSPDGYFLDWAPGHSPYVAPDGMSFPIEPGSDLVLMLHLRPDTKPEAVQATVGLYFTDTPPTRVPTLLRLTRQDFDIAAGVKAHTVSASFTLPVDIDVYTVQPHAHNLARRVEGFATLPNGTTKWLVRIDDWDFNWQAVYRYVRPVSLPAGARVVMRWTYDNSAGNRRNPNRPPRPVTFGQRTSDEMSELWFQVVPRSSLERRMLVQALQATVRLEDLKGYEVMLRAMPERVSMHDDAALLYVQAGSLERAAEHFAESARLQPGSAPAQYNLGAARLALGRREEARESFLKAVQLNPDYANAYRGLGIVFQSNGLLDDAATNYRLAIERARNDAESHHRLGTVLHAQGRFVEGVAEYREALRIKGDDVDTLVDLAWALATTPNPDQRQPQEALQLAQRARQLAPSPNSVLLDVLSASQAAVGAFEQAALTADQALTLARAQRDDHSAEAIAARVELYRQHKPFLRR